MRLETLKKRIDQIAVKRMLQESVEHFDARNPKRLEWRQCDYCSDLYNRHEEPCKSNGANKHFCCIGCKDRAAVVAQTIHALANKRQERVREKQVSADASGRLKALVKAFGARQFNYLDAAIALKINKTTAEARIKDMVSLGWLVRHAVTKDGVRAWFSVAKDALEWAREKEAKRCRKSAE